MAKKRKTGSPILKILTGIIILAAVGYLIYAGASYAGSETEQSGVVVCDADGVTCKISLHIHAQTYPSVCGERLRFPLETGALDRQHTHKERNYIHFHDAILYDINAQEIIETDRLKLGEFLDNMGVRFTSECLGDKCNGDLCGDTPGKLTMTVNGVPNTEFRDYVWKDGDEITITFE